MRIAFLVCALVVSRTELLAQEPAEARPPLIRTQTKTTQRALRVQSRAEMTREFTLQRSSSADGAAPASTWELVFRRIAGSFQSEAGEVAFDSAKPEHNKKLDFVSARWLTLVQRPLLVTLSADGRPTAAKGIPARSIAYGLTEAALVEDLAAWMPPVAGDDRASIWRRDVQAAGRLLALVLELQPVDPQGVVRGVGRLEGDGVVASKATIEFMRGDTGDSLPKTLTFTLEAEVAVRDKRDKSVNVGLSVEAKLDRP